MIEKMVCKDNHYNVGKYNPFFGKTHTAEVREKIRQSKLGSKNPNYGKKLPSGENHPNWKEDYTTVDNSMLHKWVRKQIPKPEKCEVCNINPSLDLANVTGVYNRDLTNWQYQCRKCHMLIDGRMSSIHYEMDMNNRTCLLCGICHKKRLESYARDWYQYENGHICKKCYYKIRYKQKQGAVN